jgi:hypothetical protein
MENASLLIINAQVGLSLAEKLSNVINVLMDTRFKVEPALPAPLQIVFHVQIRYALNAQLVDI